MSEAPLGWKQQSGSIFAGSHVFQHNSLQGDSGENGTISSPTTAKTKRKGWLLKEKRTAHSSLRHICERKEKKETHTAASLIMNKSFAEHKAIVTHHITVSKYLKHTNPGHTKYFNVCLVLSNTCYLSAVLKKKKKKKKYELF